MTEQKYSEVRVCPFCGSEGCMGTHFDYLVKAWVTDFNCDTDDTHHCLIVRLPPTVVVELRTIPRDEAKKLIEDYLMNNDGKDTSDVMFDLGLSADLVLGILEELKREGKIEAINIHSSVPKVNEK